MKTYITEQEVRYAETDRMKVVHHSTYLLWFEIGRTGLLRDAGYPYHELEASGTLFPVIEFSCRLIGAADYGDLVRIETHIDNLRSRTVEFAYRAYTGDKLIATGVTKHVCVDAENTVRRMPGPLHQTLVDYLDVKSEYRSR